MKLAAEAIYQLIYMVLIGRKFLRYILTQLPSYIFPPVAQRLNAGNSLLIYEVSRSHTTSIFDSTPLDE